MSVQRSSSARLLLILVVLLAPFHDRTVLADEFWVAPTSQQDAGGLQIGSNVVWPVTPRGVVRFAWAIPNNLQAFQHARVALIPHAPGGAATLHLIVCGAQNNQVVTGPCAGPVGHAFAGVANQLKEVDISAVLAPHVGAPGLKYLAVVAYTTPTTPTDHIVGLRFAYAPAGPTVVGTTTINSGNLDLDPSSAGAGNLTKNGTRFLHNFGTNNTFLGATAGNFTMTGGEDTAVGALALSSNTTGNYNTANGARALQSNTTGSSNTALGAAALSDNTTGGANTAVGTAALTNNTQGRANTAVGGSALGSNTTGENNTAVGANALVFNNGFNNTAVGAEALFSSTTSQRNTAVGNRALYATTGNSNTAVGDFALEANTAGHLNVAVGHLALHHNISGTQNVAIGVNSLQENVAGEDNVAIGHWAGTNSIGSNNIYLGASVYGATGDNGTMRLGAVGTQTRTFVAGVRGITTGSANAVPVLIDSNGQLGTASSSRRVKEDISDMADASQRLFQLRPVTFRYSRAYHDGSKPIQFGLIAEEVADVFPELAVRNAEGDIESVHYETLNVLLLNELQKQRRELQAQRERTALLEQRMNEWLARSESMSR